MGQSYGGFVALRMSQITWTFTSGPHCPSIVLSGKKMTRFRVYISFFARSLRCRQNKDGAGETDEPPCARRSLSSSVKSLFKGAIKTRIYLWSSAESQSSEIKRDGSAEVNFIPGEISGLVAKADIAGVILR